MYVIFELDGMGIVTGRANTGIIEIVPCYVSGIGILLDQISVGRIALDQGNIVNREYSIESSV